MRSHPSGKSLSLYPPFAPNDLMQPHIHPSPRATSNKPLIVPPYKPKLVVPISPHTLPVPLPPPYSRTTWLIPIRGTLPWDDSTSAVVLDSSFSKPVPPNPDTGDPIMWTHASIASFWSYLLGLRKSRPAGTIGLSFHASRPSSQPSSPHSHSASEINAFSLISGVGNQLAFESHAASDPGSIVIASAPGLNHILSNVDHIKVYHEAPNSMQVRNALHVWSYPPILPSAEGISGPSVRVRVLKGARLVLLDERSRGILIA